MIVRRRGISMIEMSVVIALAAIILSIIANLLTALYRTESHFRYDARHRQSMARLSIQLRQDAHAATSAEIVPGDEKNKTTASLLLSLPKNYKIRYELENRRLTRTKHFEDAVVHRDSFRLPKDTSVEMEITENDSLPMVAMKISSRPFDITEIERTDIDLIEAAIGLDHRVSLSKNP